MSVLTARRPSAPSRIGNPGAFGEQAVNFAVVAIMRSVTDRLPVVAVAGSGRKSGAGRAMIGAQRNRRNARFDRITWELDGDLRYAGRADLAIREEHMAIAGMRRAQQVLGSLSVCGGGGS